MSAPRIIGGAFKGRKLVAPAGLATRPTALRARQAAFDILLHAPWGGLGFLSAARVLDVFAGTGAFGLEALSRGAAAACFIENAAPALLALRENVAASGAGAAAVVVAADALAPPVGTPHELVFLDPPYGQDLVARAVAALGGRGWIAAGAIIVAELGAGDEVLAPEPLAVRRHGKARLVFWRRE